MGRAKIVDGQERIAAAATGGHVCSQARLQPVWDAGQFNENLLAVPEEKLHLVADFVEDKANRWNKLA